MQIAACIDHFQKEIEPLETLIVVSHMSLAQGKSSLITAEAQVIPTKETSAKA